MNLIIAEREGLRRSQRGDGGVFENGTWDMPLSRRNIQKYNLKCLKKLRMQDTDLSRLSPVPFIFFKV